MSGIISIKRDGYNTDEIVKRSSRHISPLQLVKDMECQIINHVYHFHLDQIRVVHTSIRRPRCPQHRRNQVQPKEEDLMNVIAGSGLI